MRIPDRITILGYTKNREAAERTLADARRAGFDGCIHWNFPTPYTEFIQRHLPKANRTMRTRPAFMNSGLGHYSILCIERDLGRVPVFVAEDDCRFLKDAACIHETLASAPDDADLLLLDSFGATRTQDLFLEERRTAKSGWAKVTSARSAACYIVGERFIDRLINLGDRGTRGKKVRIFDQWFENRWLVGANIYCAVPNLAIQMDDPSRTRPSGVSNRTKYVNMGIDFNDYGEW
jgi:hypothetical protein